MYLEAVDEQGIKELRFVGVSSQEAVISAHITTHTTIAISVGFYKSGFLLIIFYTRV